MEKNISKLSRIAIQKMAEDGMTQDIHASTNCDQGDYEKVLDATVPNWHMLVFDEEGLPPVMRLCNNSWITCDESMRLIGQYECGAKTHTKSSMCLQDIFRIYPPFDKELSESTVLLMYANLAQVLICDQDFREEEEMHTEEIYNFMAAMLRYKYREVDLKFDFKGIKEYAQFKRGIMTIQSRLSVPVYSWMEAGVVELGVLSFFPNKVIYADYVNDQMIRIDFEEVEDEDLQEVWKQFMFIPLHLAGVQLTQNNSVCSGQDSLSIISGIGKDEIGLQGIATGIEEYFKE